MDAEGWLVNDCLTCIPGTRTFWHDLLQWLPKLVDKTNGHTSFGDLAGSIERQLVSSSPRFIIRNATYFRRINTNIPTISILQDVVQNKNEQLDVLNNSTVAVFVSGYVLNKYRDLLKPSLRTEIIPHGIDFSTFKPQPINDPRVLPNSVLFIGAATDYPKGFHILRQIISTMTTTNFCLVMKDNFNINMLPESVRSRVVIFNRIPTYKVVEVINSCKLAVCTSLEETEHLAGLECMACNLPVVARPVGAYYDMQHSSEWGIIANDDNFPEKIEYVMNNLHLFSPRAYTYQYFSTDKCAIAWRNLIESVV